MKMPYRVCENLQYAIRKFHTEIIHNTTLYYIYPNKFRHTYILSDSITNKITYNKM